MRYKEALPKLMVVLFGLTLFFYFFHKEALAITYWDCGLDDSSYPAHLEALRIGQIFSFVLLATNICFLLYVKAEETLAVFQSFLAMVVNVIIAFDYTEEIMPSFERIILWMPHFILGEVVGEISPTSVHSQVYKRLSFLSISTILIFGFMLLNRKFIIPYIHRLAATKALNNK